GLRLQVPVEAVLGGVELAVVVPLVERRVRLVEGFRERLAPAQLLARETRPESLEVLLGLRAQGVVGGHARDVRLLHERLGRREDAALVENRFDGGGLAFGFYGGHRLETSILGTSQPASPSTSFCHSVGGAARPAIRENPRMDAMNAVLDSSATADIHGAA